MKGEIAIPQMVALSEVAKRLATTTRALRKMSREGRFPRVYYFGRQWRVVEAEVLAWREELPGDPARDAEHDAIRNAVAGKATGYGPRAWAP